MSERVLDTFAGFGRSPLLTFTIPNGATTIDAQDLRRNYAFLLVICEDATRIAAATTLKWQVAHEDGATPVDLWKSGGTGIAESGVLPSGSGSFAFLVPDAFGAQILKPVLSVAASGGNVVLKVYGLDSSVERK